MPNKLKRFIETIEGQKLNVFIWIITLFSIIFARNFLEGILERGHIIGLHADPQTSYITFFIHFPFWYINLVLALSIVLKYLTRERIERILRILIPFSLIILFPPLIDFIISKGNGFIVSYIGSSKDAFLLLTQIFNPLVNIRGFTPGMRIEVAIACIFTFIYVIVKTKNVLKAFIGSLGLYLIVFLWATLPVIISNILNPLIQGPISPVLPYLRIFRSGGLIQTEPQKLSLIFLFLFVLCSVWVYYLYDRKKFRAILSNLRPLRSIHYCGMVLFGVFVGYMLFKNTYIFPFSNPYDYFAIFSLLLSMFFAFQSAVALNDVFDLAGDRESNITRPLVKGSLTEKEHILLSCFFFGLAFLFSFIVRPFSFILILFYSLLLFIYSAPPLRIKKIFPISTFILSLLALISIYLGFSMFAFEKTTYIFPPRIAFLILFVFTLSFTAKDIKDFKGDKKMNIFTIPTIFGEKKGKIIIAILLLISYLSIPLITRIYWIFIPSSIIGIFTSAVILSKRPRESYMFFAYFIFAISLILSAFINKDNVFRKMTKISSVDPIGNFHNGERALDRGFSQDAIRPYEDALSSGLDSGYIRRRLGYAYLLCSNYNAAIKELERAREKNHSDPHVYSFLGQAYTRSKIFANADAIYKSAIRRRMLPREMFMLWGERYRESGDTENCIKHLWFSISLGESSGRAYRLLGEIFLSTGSLHESEKAFKNSIRINQESSESYEGLGEVYHRLGKKRDALMTLKKAVSLNPLNPLTHNNLGIIYYEEEEFENAEKEFLLALKIGGSLPAIHTNLGRTYLKTEKLELAQKEFEKALEQDSLNKEAKEGIYIINKLRGG